MFGFRMKLKYLSVSALVGLALITLEASVRAIQLSPEAASKIGRKVWENESGGSVGGLVSWNSGEAFPSLGIGHFIWYPKANRGPFEESFPELVLFYKQRGVDIPDWLSGPAPWRTRAEMIGDVPRTRQLGVLLIDTVGIQTEFLIQRLDAALPKMLVAAPATDKDRIRARFQSVSSTPAGVFALVDYVNFKGEGVLETERYNGQGWGMLQVLQGMRGGSDPVRDFSESASQVLARRVRNSPSARHEDRWLAGWQNRVKQYAGH